MKNWIIKKKVFCPDNTTDSQSRPAGRVNSVLVPEIPSSVITNTEDLPTEHHPTSILKESDTLYNDHIKPVEFDFLENSDSLEVTSISDQVSPYLSFKYLMGSVSSVFASQVISSD
jgi:hypothetical protein